MIICSWITR